MTRKSDQSSSQIIFQSKRQPAARLAFQLALGYMVIGALWIMFSPYLVQIIAPGQDYMVWERVKGWLYVLATGAGLFYFAARQLRRVQQLDENLMQSVRTHQQEIERYHMLLGASTDDIILYDADKHFLAITDHVASVIGLPAPQVIGCTPSQVFVPERAALVEQAIEDTVKQQKPLRVIRQWPGPSGLVWRDTIYTPVFDSDADMIKAVLVVSRNVTDKMAIETNLRLRNEQYKALLDTISLIGQTLRLADVVRGVLDQVQFILGSHVEVCLKNGEQFECIAANQTQYQSLVGTFVKPADYPWLALMVQNHEPVIGMGASDNRYLWTNIPKPPACWMVVPFVVRGEIIGFLALSRDERQPFTHDEQESTAAFARSAAIAISNAQLFEALESSEADYRQLVDSIDDMVYRADADGNQLYINAKGREIQELDESDTGIGPWLPYIHPDDRETTLARFRQQLTTGDRVHLVNRVLGKRGRITYVSHHIRALSDASGKIVGLLGIGRDVTDQIHAAQAAERHSQQLATLNHVLQAALQPVGLPETLDVLLTEISSVFKADAVDIHRLEEHTGQLSLMAHRGYTMGYEEKYRILPVEDSLRGEAVQTRKVIVHSAEHLKTKGTLRHPATDFPSAAVAPVWAHDMILGTLAIVFWQPHTFNEDDVALLEALGRGIGIVIENARLYAQVQSDAEVLKQKVAERTEELEAALLRAQSADRMKSSLLSTVSHEMRTPLSSIIGFSNLIMSRKPDEAKALEYVSAINAESRRLADLINDFLDLQRIESGREVFHYANIDLGGLAQDVVNKMQFGDDGRHNVKLDVMPVAPVRADGNRIRQVILNLISNAIKYSPDGGEIMLSIWQEDGEVLFTIRDQGLGIAPDEVNHLFERFFRGNIAQRFRIRGTGLGLALCHEIIHGHGGRLWVNSPGLHQGSTFGFALPVFQPVEVAVPAPEASPVKRILVIEDEPGCSIKLKQELQPERYTVQALAFSEATANEVMRLSPVLLIIDVLQATRDTGWSLLMNLKRDSVGRHIPVMICSMLDTPDRAWQFGASSFITKPVDDSFLMSEIIRLAGKPPRHVLVVDDEAITRLMLHDTLTGAGYLVETAVDGREAIERMEANWPDMVVLDLLMPQMDGFTVLEWVRIEKQNFELPVLVLTAAELTANEQQIIREGANALAIKSNTSPEQLLDLVRRVLEAEGH